VAGSELIWAFRVMRLPLLDAEGAAIGRFEDIVLSPGLPDEPPDVLGFVAASQRRRIFVNANRVATLENDGARLRSWDVDLNPFKLRAGELLVSDLIDRKMGEETVHDVALRPTSGKSPTWEVVKVRLGRRSPLRRRGSYRVVDWDEVAPLFAASSEAAAEAARLRDMHPSDVAHLVLNLPLPQRRQLAEAMEDDRLADVLEELSEAEQLGLIADLDLDRLVSVLEEMEYDDAVDLLAEMPGDQRSRVLVSIAAQVFVVQPPLVAPTGTFLGVVDFQRLLREPPSMPLLRCVEDIDVVAPDTTEREVAERLAAYNLLAIPVCDARRHLLGAITVDDVLDRSLPAGWRQRRRPAVRSS
jgi:hypothetical protein